MIRAHIVSLPISVGGQKIHSKVMSPNKGIFVGADFEKIVKLLHFWANDSQFWDEFFSILLTKKGYIEISMMRVSESNKNGGIALLSIKEQ